MYTIILLFEINYFGKIYLIIIRDLPHYGKSPCYVVLSFVKIRKHNKTSAMLVVIVEVFLLSFILDYFFYKLFINIKITHRCFHKAV